MCNLEQQFVQPSIPRFDGHYDFWSMTTKNFLRSKELWELVEDGITTLVLSFGSDEETQKKVIEEAHETKLKDLKVKNFLFQSIDREILETILNKSTSKAIWDSMRQTCKGSTRVKRAQLQTLRREFELLIVKDGRKWIIFSRTMIVVSKMKSNGEVLEQSTMMSKILRSLTLKFNYVVWTWE